MWLGCLHVQLCMCVNERSVVSSLDEYPFNDPEPHGSLSWEDIYPRP